MAKNNAINNRSGQLTIDPGASGDSFVQYAINATDEWRVGCDDTDDSYRISQGSALGTNDTFIATAAGEITRPLTPAFLGYVASQDANVTGDNTLYLVGTNVAYTEIFDQGGDFTTAGVFTAPVTGRYVLTGSVQILIPVAGGLYFTLVIVTSNRTFYGSNYPSRNNVVGLYGVSESLSPHIFCIADMDAADTASLRIAANTGAKTSDINAGSSSDLYTRFAGYLVV